MHGEEGLVTLWIENSSSTGNLIEKILHGKKDLSMREIERLMFGNNIGHLPIVEDGKTIGLITRTDYLNFIKYNNHSDSLINTVSMQT